MAFHGDLDGIDLEDIIALIGARSGVLSLGPIQGKTLNLHVAAGLVASFSIEQNIEGKDRIFKLARWFSRHRCSFSFEQKPINATQGPASGPAAAVSAPTADRFSDRPGDGPAIRSGHGVHADQGQEGRASTGAPAFPGPGRADAGKGCQ